MFTLLVKFIFTIITKLFSLIFTPFFSALYLLFPDLTNILPYILSFLNYSVTYVSSLTYLLFIPTGALLLFFDYLIIKYSIFLIRQSITFVSRVYNLLKP